MTMRTAKKTAPAPAPAPTFEHKPGRYCTPLCDEIVLGDNYRTSSNAEADAELLESVRRHGVLQPITVRPFGEADGPLQLVYGARRLRAALAAGLATIPAIARDLTDAEVLELQLIENAQRADVDPVQEAVGVARLIEVYGRSVEDLAAAWNRPRAWFSERLRLAHAAPEVLEALASGYLKLGHALEFARLASTGVQAEALEAVRKLQRAQLGDPNALEFSVSELRKTLQSDFTLRLSSARWDLDDAELLPAAGACSACPKRTSCTPELFEELKAPSCTDAHCWAEKLAAHNARADARLAARGMTVLGAAKSGRALDRTGRAKRGYLRLDRSPTGGIVGGKAGSLAKMLGKHLKPEDVVIARDNEGEAVELITVDRLKVVAKAAKLKLPRPAPNRSSGSAFAEHQANEAAQKRRRDAADPVARRLFDELVDALRVSLAEPADVFRAVAETFIAAALGDGRQYFDKGFGVLAVSKALGLELELKHDQWGLNAKDGKSSRDRIRAWIGEHHDAERMVTAAVLIDWLADSRIGGFYGRELPTKSLAESSLAKLCMQTSAVARAAVKRALAEEKAAIAALSKAPKPADGEPEDGKPKTSKPRARTRKA